MKYHVLAGDALAEDFRKTNVEGAIIVCRECLVEGETRAANLKEFWNARARFVESAYGENDYVGRVVTEFEKMQDLSEGAEVNLWFEYELFCQVNLWFCLSLLSGKKVEIYRIAPVVRNETDVWKGFGNLEKEDLEKCYAERIKFSDDDVSLGVKLWKAFQNKDLTELNNLGTAKSDPFPKLAEVCEAAIDIESRPQAVLREIVAFGEDDFSEIYRRFAEKAGVYGFGDSQVKRLLRNC